MDSQKLEGQQTALYELERQTGIVRDRVLDIAARRHTSLYFFGRRGTGKTRLVRNTLHNFGEDHHYVAGHVTPMGFFDELREHADETIVFDDVTNLFRNPIGQQLILAAFGTASEGELTRTITYHERHRKEVVYFSGGVIAISNLQLHDSDVMNAIKSRTRPLGWDPSEIQMAAMMHDAVKGGLKTNGVDLTAEECDEVANFVIEQCHRYAVRLDLRLFFDGALPDFAATELGEHEINWRDHTTAAIREQIGRMQYSGPPKTRAERLAMEAKIAERIRSTFNTRREQVEAWAAETGKSERAFDRRSAGLHVAAG